jgi:WD40 repeat protein
MVSSSLLSASHTILSCPRRSQNTIAFTQSYLLTGGENGVCYVWSVKPSATTVGGAGWGVEKVAELNQQTGPIKALSLHPSKDWCASSSDDGSCVVWDLKSLKYIGLVSSLSLSLSHTHTGRSNAQPTVSLAVLSQQRPLLQRRARLSSVEGQCTSPVLLTPPSPPSGSLVMERPYSLSSVPELDHLTSFGAVSSTLRSPHPPSLRWSLEEQDLKAEKGKQLATDPTDSLKSTSLHLTLAPMA